MAIIFQTQSSTEPIGFKKNYQPDPWYPTSRRASDYRKAVAALEALLDAGGADERHPLAGLVAVSGEFIDLYEKRSGQW